MNFDKTSLVPLLDDKIILNFINDKNLIFKNAQKSISLNSKDDICVIIFNMIKYGNPHDYLDKFPIKQMFHSKRNCCLNPNHKDPLAQQFSYEISINNKLITYCNNCIDVMVRLSKKSIYQLGKIHYKKLSKLYLLIRKSLIYDSLDIDCFRMIFIYCIKC